MGNSLASLVEQLGYKAIRVNKSVEALKNYKKWTPDLVLIDRSMPELDGIACIKKIMKNDPKARIVIISGYEQSGQNGIDQDVKKMIKGYLTKPCGVRDLSRMIYRALEA